MADGFAHAKEQLRFQLLANAPETGIRDAGDAIPVGRIGLPFLPADTEIAFEGFKPFRGEEGLQMHAIGDVVDRVFVRLDLRPEMAANIGRDIAMNARNAVVMA